MVGKQGGCLTANGGMGGISPFAGSGTGRILQRGAHRTHALKRSGTATAVGSSFLGDLLT